MKIFVSHEHCKKIFNKKSRIFLIMTQILAFVYIKNSERAVDNARALNQLIIINSTHLVYQELHELFIKITLLSRNVEIFHKFIFPS